MNLNTERGTWFQKRKYSHNARRSYTNGTTHQFSHPSPHISRTAWSRHRGGLHPVRWTEKWRPEWRHRFFCNETPMRLEKATCNLKTATRAQQQLVASLQSLTIVVPRTAVKSKHVQYCTTSETYFFGRNTAPLGTLKLPKTRDLWVRGWAVR